MGGSGAPSARPATLCDGGSLCGAATDGSAAPDSRGPAEPTSAIAGDRACESAGAEMGPRLDNGGGTMVIREVLGHGKTSGVDMRLQKGSAPMTFLPFLPSAKPPVRVLTTCYSMLIGAAL